MNLIFQVVHLLELLEIKTHTAEEGIQKKSKRQINRVQNESTLSQ